MTAGHMHMMFGDAQIEISPALQTIVIPIGDIEGRGIDLTIAWDTPIDGLSLYFSGNTNEVELDNVDDAIQTKNPFMVNGSQLPGTAKTTYSIRSNYTTEMDNGMMFNANALFSYRDKVTSVFDGRVSEDIELLSGSLSVARDSWKIGIFGRNLLQEEGPSGIGCSASGCTFPRNSSC